MGEKRCRCRCRKLDGKPIQAKLAYWQPMKNEKPSERVLIPSSKPTKNFSLVEEKTSIPLLNNQKEISGPKINI